MIRRLIVLAVAGTSLALPLAARAASAPAVAATSTAAAATPTTDFTEVAGIRFDNTLQLGGAKLHLNGAGVRYKAIFKVYAAGLYLGTKASTTEAVLNGSGPRRLHIVMLREINADDFGKMFTRGMEQNVSRSEFSKVIPGVIRMSDIFSLRKKLMAGDYFSIDYLPGTGSVVMLNGKPASDPIKEPEFFNAMMKIWLGKSPADSQLKDALLGKASSNARDAFN